MNAVPTSHGPGQPCIFRVVRVSGTIRKAEEEAVRRAKQLILAAQGETAGSSGSGLLSPGQTPNTNSTKDLEGDDGFDVEDDDMSNSET